MQHLRLLIAPDSNLFTDITRVLNAAIAEDPETWSYNPGEPSIVENYGYHTMIVSATVLAPEHRSAYWRLTLRDGSKHPVFAELRKIVARHYGLGE